MSREAKRAALIATLEKNDFSNVIVPWHAKVQSAGRELNLGGRRYRLVPVDSADDEAAENHTLQQSRSVAESHSSQIEAQYRSSNLLRKVEAFLPVDAILRLRSMGYTITDPPIPQSPPFPLPPTGPQPFPFPTFPHPAGPNPGNPYLEYPPVPLDPSFPTPKCSWPACGGPPKSGPQPDPTLIDSEPWDNSDWGNWDNWRDNPGWGNWWN